MFRLEFVFELYLGVDDDVSSARGCISEKCDILVLDDILFCGRQAGAKTFFVCIIIGLCRSIKYNMEPAVMQQYILL